MPTSSPCTSRASTGRTAWTVAEGKRQLAETANSFLHGAAGALIDIGWGYTRMLDSGRLELFVTFTLVGDNRSRIHVWLQDHRMLPATHPDALAPVKTTRAPRRGRQRRFDDLRPTAGTGPPAASAA